MISITSEEQADSPAQLIRGNFDLIIVGASWDLRCQSILACRELYTENAVILAYRNKGRTGRSADSLKLLREFFRRAVASRTHVVEMESADMIGSWTVLRECVVETYSALGRPLRIAIDLSSVPRYVSLGLLGFCTRSGTASQVTYWYTAAARYEVEHEGGAVIDNYQFTVGRWLPQPIPALSRPTSGGRPMHLIVSAGIEGPLIRRMVEDLEPAMLSMLYAVNNQNEVSEKARSENRALEQSFLLSPDDSVDLPLFSTASVVSTLGGLLDRYQIDPQGREVEHSLLVSGAKPHALAFAIAACEYDVKNVFFGLPEARREVTGVGLGPFYRCDLRMPLVG